MGSTNAKNWHSHSLTNQRPHFRGYGKKKLSDDELFRLNFEFWENKKSPYKISVELKISLAVIDRELFHMRHDWESFKNKRT